MGFFSGGGLGGLLGGGTKGTSTPMTSGFAAAPAEIQNVYKELGTNISSMLSKDPTAAAQYYKPLSVSGAEQSAIDAINRGFTPDAAQLQSDIAMQMNPFDQFVIDAINREGMGANSILQQNLQGAGQSGSNRQLLGANDIDLSRMQQIGGFKQSQYNTALQNALETLTTGRRQDAATQLGAGEFLRGLDLETKQAPIAALREASALAGSLNPVIQQTQTQAGTAGTKGNALTGISNIASLASSIFKSDIRLKENIIPVGEENGHKVYEFSYKEDPKRYIGVMAQEVEKTHPEAVTEWGGYKAVNYDAIGVKFREVASV